MALNLMSAKLALQDMIRSGNISVSGLFDLASQVDARVQNVSPGSTFLLYSGGADAAAISANLATTAPDVYDLGSTAAGEFADSVEFGNALRDAIAKEQFGTTYGNATAPEQALIKASVDQHVYGVDSTGARVSSTSLFDIISHSYVMENDGNWRIIAVGGVDPNSVAMQTELPALLSKPGDFLINGESRTALAQAGSLAEQVNMAIAQSAAISEASLVSTSSAGEFLSMTTQKALQILAAPESAALLESAAATLNKLGWAGMLLSAAIVTQEANAAYASGDSAKGNTLIGNWIGEFAAGWAGAILASEMVGSALAPLYLTGPAGALIAGGLTLLAGLAGGILGAQGAGALLSKVEGLGIESLIKSLQTFFRSALQPVDPLVLDLNGSGIKTVGIDSGAHFDYNGTGFAQKTAWVTPDEGILVIDKNGDGKITGDELIGNAGTDATTTAANGFTTMASLNSNSDGVIDARDPAFSQLRVWIDANGDGTSQAGELKTLGELGITSLSLAYTGESVTDTNGNKHLAISSFTTADGKTHTMEDVWLNVDTARTINAAQVSVSGTIAALPDIAGFGNVRSLHAAMALDMTGQLQSLVQSFIAAIDPTQRAQIATNLIYAWAGVAQNDPNGRDNRADSHVIDARKIETLEAFLGQHYARNNGAGADPNPPHGAAPILSHAFDELVSYVSGQLLAQTELKDLYGSVRLSLGSNGKAILDVSALVGTLSAMYQKDTAATKKIITDLGSSLKTQGEFGQQVSAALRAQGSFGQAGFLGQLAALGANVIAADAIHLVVRGQEGVENILIGVDGATLYASSGNDQLLAGSGDETLYGGTGKDTFVFQPGFGKDTLIETTKFGRFNQDVVQFGNGVSAAQAQICRDTSNNLVLVFSESSRLTILGYFSSASNQPAITFADGTTWDYTAITNNLVFADTSAGGNTLYGLSGVDNRIVGATGDAIYAGNRNDTITVGKNNTVYGG
ncbi:hypothetical protein G3N57_00495, partial [Paraburkholderia sp. Se-20369]|nr:hypothetical protein [Paraburkholderia sp. Se-20369]